MRHLLPVEKMSPSQDCSARTILARDIADFAFISLLNPFFAYARNGQSADPELSLMNARDSHNNEKTRYIFQSNVRQLKDNIDVSQLLREYIYLTWTIDQKNHPLNIELEILLAI